MLRLAKAFLDIALGRQTPADLPASVLLLGLAAVAAALMEVLGALLPPPPPNDQLLLRVLLEVGMPLLFSWILLSLARRHARFLQTATALLGVGALAAVVLYPLNSILQLMGQDNLAALPVGVLYIAFLIGYLLACAHIWRSALDSGFLLGAAVSLGYFIISLSIERQVLLRS